MTDTREKPCRPAFTLIELLVVIGLILLLAALAVAFYPDISTSNRSSTGASSLQGWLLIAKQRAKRDGLPTGIRFLLFSSGGLLFCNQMVYVQQPDDFAVGRCTQVTRPVSGAMTATINVNLHFNQYSATNNEDQFDVQNGDYFELYGGGIVHQINSVTTASLTALTPGTVQNTLLTMIPKSAPYPGTTTGTTTLPTGGSSAGPNYRIIRQPRELVGEPVLTLPSNIAIDLNTFSAGPPLVNYSNPPQRSNLGGSSSYTYREIIFSPTGAVIGSGNQNPYDGQIYLWVRDISTIDIHTNPQLGYPTIVAVETRTGYIGAYPIAYPLSLSVNNNDMFYYSKAARSPGL